MQRSPIKDNPKLKEIESELIKGTPYLKLKEKYGYSTSALSKYKTRHLTRKVSTYQHNKDYRDGEVIYTLLGEYIDNVNKITNSVMKALEDPDDPELLDVGVQAKEVNVTYYKTNEDGSETKRRLPLQTLLDRLDGRVTRVEINTPDRVQTLIQASHAMNKHLHLLGDLRGMIGNTTVNIMQQPVFIEFTQTVIQALEDYPEARQAVGLFIRQQAELDESEPLIVSPESNKLTGEKSL